MGKLSNVTWLNVVLVVYALVTFAGGVYAYFGTESRSRASLYSAAVAAIIILIAVYWAQKNPRAGYALAAFVIGALLAFFLYRLATGHPMPGLPMSLLSLAAMICLAVGYYQMKRSETAPPDLGF